NHLLFTYPKLYLANAASLYITGYKDEATASYWWATERLEESTTRLTKTEIQEFKAGLDFLVVFRSFIEKDFSSFLIYSKKYLEVVPEGDLFINFGSDKDGHHLVWDVFVSDEYTEESGVLLQEALHLWGKSVNRPFQAHLSMDYARLLYEKN